MNRKLLIYVTGPINTMNEPSHKRSMTAISLACRSVLLSGHLPVCPILSIVDYQNDPRIKFAPEWWINHYCGPMMEYCQHFCYIPDMVGMKTQLCEMEKDKWRLMKSGRMVMADTIMKFLLSLNREQHQPGDTVYVTSG